MKAYYDIDELIFMLQGNDKSAKKTASIQLTEHPNIKALNALKLSLINCDAETAYFIRRAVSKIQITKKSIEKVEPASPEDIKNRSSKAVKEQFEFLVALQNWIFFYDMLEQKYIELAKKTYNKYSEYFDNSKLRDSIFEITNSIDNTDIYNKRLKKLALIVKDISQTLVEIPPDIKKIIDNIDHIKEKVVIKKLKILNIYSSNYFKYTMGLKISSIENIFNRKVANNILIKGSYKFSDFIIKRIIKEKVRKKLSVFLFLAEHIKEEKCKKAVKPHLLSQHSIIRFQALKCMNNFIDKDTCKLVIFMLNDSEKTIRDMSEIFLKTKFLHFIKPSIKELSISEKGWHQEAAFRAVKIFKLNDRNFLKDILVKCNKSSIFFKSIIEEFSDILVKKKDIKKVENSIESFKILVDQVENMSYPSAMLAIKEFKVKTKDKELLKKIDDFIIFYKNKLSNKETDMPNTKEIFEHTQYWISHPSYKVRIYTIKILKEDKYSNWTKVLIDQLEKEDHPYVISYLTKTIGSITNDDVVWILSKYLKHEDYRVRANTIEGLFHVNSPVILSLVKPLVNDKNTRVRITAIQLIATFDNKIASDVLCEMLFSKDIEKIKCALFSLNKMRIKDFVHIFKRIAKLGDHRLKLETFRYLVTLKDKYNFISSILLEFPKEFHILENSSIEENNEQYFIMALDKDATKRFSALKILSSIFEDKKLFSETVEKLLTDDNNSVAKLVEHIGQMLAIDSEIEYIYYDIGKYIFSNANKFINISIVANIIKNSRDLFYVNESKLTTGSFKSKQMYNWIGQRIEEISKNNKLNDDKILEYLKHLKLSLNKKKNIIRKIDKIEYQDNKL